MAWRLIEVPAGDELWDEDLSDADLIYLSTLLEKVDGASLNASAAVRVQSRIAPMVQWALRNEDPV